MTPIIMNCINSSVEGVYPLVVSHNFPSASHDPGEVGSKVDTLKLSIPVCEVVLVFDSIAVTETSSSFEDVLAAAIDDDLDIESLLVDIDENSAFGSRGVEGVMGGPKVGESDRKSRPNSSFLELVVGGLIPLSLYRV